MLLLLLMLPRVIATKSRLAVAIVLLLVVLVVLVVLVLLLLLLVVQHSTLCMREGTLPLAPPSFHAGAAGSSCSCSKASLRHRSKKKLGLFTTRSQMLREPFEGQPAPKIALLLASTGCICKSKGRRVS
jgi:hypothetical protein